jgi:hypothetical protein
LSKGLACFPHDKNAHTEVVKVVGIVSHAITILKDTTGKFEIRAKRFNPGIQFVNGKKFFHKTFGYLATDNTVGLRAETKRGYPAKKLAFITEAQGAFIVFSEPRIGEAVNIPVVVYRQGGRAEIQRKGSFTSPPPPFLGLARKGKRPSWQKPQHQEKYF